MAFVNLFTLGDFTITAYEYDDGADTYTLLTPEEMEDAGMSYTLNGDNSITYTQSNNPDRLFQLRIAPDFEIERSKLRLTLIESLVGDASMVFVETTAIPTNDLPGAYFDAGAWVMEFPNGEFGQYNSDLGEYQLSDYGPLEYLAISTNYSEQEVCTLRLSFDIEVLPNRTWVNVLETNDFTYQPVTFDGSDWVPYEGMEYTVNPDGTIQIQDEASDDESMLRMVPTAPLASGYYRLRVQNIDTLSGVSSVQAQGIIVGDATTYRAGAYYENGEGDGDLTYVPMGAGILTEYVPDVGYMFSSEEAFSYLQAGISFGETEDTGTATFSFEFAGPPPVFIAPCEELGRVTRAYVSGYQRDRIHRSRLVRGEQRCLVANFNGAIPTTRTIASVIWRCQQPYAISMANARIIGRDANVDISAQSSGQSIIKCEVTLDNGEVYNQLFVVSVMGSPYFQGETNPATGPTQLSAVA